MQNNKKVKKRPLDLDADVFPVQKRMLKNPFSEQPLEPPPVFQACAVIQNLRSAKKLELFCAGILNLITIIVLLGHFHQKCTKQDVFVLKRVIHEHCQCPLKHISILPFHDHLYLFKFFYFPNFRILQRFPAMISDYR